jgi:hypothetical protein
MEIREVTAPLEIEQIKEFIDNKELVYLVDYKNSELQGIKLLTYLSNLELPAEILFDDCSFDQKEEFFKAYMNTRSVYRTESVLFNIASLLLHYRDIDCEKIYLNQIFSEEEKSRFIENNRETIEQWEKFIESSSLFAQTCIDSLVDVENIKKAFGEINDQEAVGANVVNMFGLPAFMDLFFTAGYKHEMKYYTPQFEEYMFRGKNLYSFYVCEENTVFKMFLLHVNGELDHNLDAKVITE